MQIKNLYLTLILLIGAFTLAKSQCDADSVSTVDGATLVYTCPGDSIADLIVFTQQADSADSSANFTFVVTDTDGVILGIPANDTIDFEGAGEGTCRVWGLSYTDTLRASVGDTISTVVFSDSCADLSDNFVTIIRAVPEGGVISTADGESEVTVCLSDTLSDVLAFVANGNSAAKYALIVTDTANVILGLPAADQVDFATAGAGICRVWGLSFTGSMTVAVGDTASGDLSDDCFSLSSNFVSITRDTSCADTISPPPPPPPPSGPTSFTLINADTDADLRPIADGDSIDLSMYAVEPERLNIRYEPDTSISGIESVVFDFDGEQQFNIEQIVPYALGGDNNGDYHPTGNAMSLGTHNLTATAYSSYQGMGDDLGGASISFTLYESGDAPDPGSGPDSVSGFTLVNADTEQDIGPLNDGDTIDLSALASPNITIRADVGQVGSVVFDFNGIDGYRTENVFPYTLGGDIQPDYWAVEMPDGTYSLTATPYTSYQSMGAPGTPLSISFTVVSSPFARVQVESDRSQVLIFPNPVENSLFLEMPEGRQGPVQIDVLNPMGVLMQRETFSTATDHWSRRLNTSNLLPGVYIVHIINGMFIRTHRIIKE